MPAVRSWLMKPECLRRLQSFGWWSKPSGRFIRQPWSISWDKLLMSNLQMQLAKLNFFSSLMTKWLQGCGNSTGMHWLLLMLQADSRLLNLINHLKRIFWGLKGFSDNLWAWTTEMAQSSSGWSWAWIHGWCQESWQSMMWR